MQVAVLDMLQVKKPGQVGNNTHPKNGGSTRKYHGPLFDFPVFTRKYVSLGSSMINNNNNLTLVYDIKDLLIDESGETLKRKKIESKKLQLAKFQSCLKDEFEQRQEEIYGNTCRPYRKFVRLCDRQRGT
ncbi:ATP-dependent helicase BRM [Olea europaea subsp. europaea]|uniref:ATP-dependent helicase BRM n=1 Tax=Olea europaea subsp. europaea TaxID=158383 RepID=A0A8S0UVB0_OLEEU|nr:ATP-dependent helicase BRM [Olea europaea subsp. europaea]